MAYESGLVKTDRDLGNRRKTDWLDLGMMRIVKVDDRRLVPVTVKVGRRIGWDSDMVSPRTSTDDCETWTVQSCVFELSELVDGSELIVRRSANLDHQVVFPALPSVAVTGQLGYAVRQFGGLSFAIPAPR